jgi:hypothetical protein
MIKQELEQIAKRPIVLDLDVVTALHVLLNLQLALSHPQNKGESSKTFKKLIDAGWSRGEMN